MKLVMGELNEVRLLQIMNGAAGKCSRVTAAVAYASKTDPFFEHCQQHNIFLEYYGLLDESAAVSIPVLQQMLKDGPLSVRPRLIKGHFHSKIIWWHGYGAYIGSANLTSNAWFTNVECGVFFEEDEILGTSMEADLQLQFDYLWKVSEPVTTELVKALDKLRPVEAGVNVAKEKLKSQFEHATRGFKTHAGLTAYGPKTKTTAYTQFTSEWTETLELLRGLRKEFQKLGARPSWVAPNANPTTHFDQFLHAYYYVRVRDDRSDDESAKSVSLVEKAFERHRSNKTSALAEAVEWWFSLPTAPYGEDQFIATVAPRMQAAFDFARLKVWTLKDFQDTFFDVHAFKTHARQVRNSTLGLPRDHRENVHGRSDRVAQWLWGQDREASQHGVRELLQFLVWGSTPSDMVERLWMVTRDHPWRYDHFGPSTLGEAVGWARPDDYPPRNNRTNKALRSLGHDVRLFSA
jgi:hypothetical protein